MVAVRITVSLVEVLQPEIVICDVEWLAPTGEQIQAHIRVKASPEELPQPTPIEGVAGLVEPVHLPAAIQIEALPGAGRWRNNLSCENFDPTPS